MIRTREEVRAAAEADAQEFSELLDSSQSDTSGIPSQPRIDVSELDLQANVFDFEVFVDPFSEAIPGDGSGPPPPPPLPPCNGCGFEDYLGNGKFFLTETFFVTATRVKACLDSDPNFTCESELLCIANKTSTYDEDCVLEVTGSGNCEDSPNTARSEFCNGTIVDPTGDCFPYNEPNIFAFEISRDETHIIYHVHDDNVEPLCDPDEAPLDMTGDKILSDECTP